MNFYIDLYFSKLSTFLNEPMEFFQKHFAVNTKPGKLALYAMLSMFFRNDGNLEASEQFLALVAIFI